MILKIVPVGVDMYLMALSQTASVIGDNDPFPHPPLKIMTMENHYILFIFILHAIIKHLYGSKKIKIYVTLIWSGDYD